MLYFSIETCVPEFTFLSVKDSEPKELLSLPFLLIQFSSMQDFCEVTLLLFF